MFPNVESYIKQRERIMSTAIDVCVYMCVSKCRSEACESRSDDVTLGEIRYMAFMGRAFAPLIIHRSHEVIIIETS
jgi:hypothetical protein